MTDNKNTILAIVLSALVLLGWQYFFAAPQEKARQEQLQLQAQQQKQNVPTPDQSKPAQPQAQSQVPGQANAPSSAAPVDRRAALANSPRVPIVTDTLQGTIALKGGRIDDLALEEHDLRVGEAALRAAAEVHDDLDQRLAIGQGMHGVDDLRRQGREQRVEVVDRFPLAVLGSHADLHVSLGLAHAGRHEGWLGHADECFLHEQRHARDRIEGSILQSAIERRFVGSHG